MTGIAQRSDLVTRLTEFLFGRTDIPTAQYDLWIQLAEAEMQRKLPTRLRVGHNSAFAIATEFVDLPADFAGVIGFELTSPTQPGGLDAMSAAQLMRERRGSGKLTGQPYCYAIVGSQFRFYYAPDQPYTAELEYWQRFTALAADADTNWVLQKHPDAYFYGALAHGGGWLAEDDRAGSWATAFEAILQSIIDADKNEQPGESIQLTPSNIFGWNNRA